MNKKGGDVSWPFIIKLVIVIFVIFFVVKFVSESSWKPVKILRDSIKELLERSQPKKYTSTELIDKEAKDSLNALLYSVNRLAWFDTYYGRGNWGWDEETDIKEILENPFTFYNSNNRERVFFDSIGSWQSYARSYGDTKVIPTIRDDYRIYPRHVGSSNPVEAISNSTAKNVVDCYAMFKDKLYTDTRCFTLDFAYLDDLEIKKKDIKDALKKYMDDDSCNDKCEDIIDDILGIDILDGWDPWENLKFDIQGNKITSAHSFESEPPMQIYICSQKEGVLRKLYITDDNSKCLTPIDGLKFNFIIKDFNLPQEIRSLSDDFELTDIAARLGSIAGGGILGAASPTQYIGAYGDPKYIVFYEKFPKGEDSTWKTSMLGELGKSLSINSVFLLFNFVPVIGPYISAGLTATPASDFAPDFVARLLDLWKDGFNPEKLLTIGKSIIEDAPDLAKDIMDQINTDGNVESRHHIKDYIIIKTIGNDVLDKNFNILTNEFEIELNKEDFVKSFNNIITGYKNIKLINDDQTINSQFENDLKESYSDLLVSVGDSQKEEILTKLLDKGLFPLMQGLIPEYLFYYDVAVSANELLLNTKGITPGSVSESEQSDQGLIQFEKCGVTVQDRIDYLCGCDGCEGDEETEGTEVYDLAYGDTGEFACLYLDVEDKDISLCDVNFPEASYCDEYNLGGDLYNPNGGFCSNNLKICPNEFILNDHDYCMCGPYTVTSSATDTIDEESEAVFLMIGDTGYCCANEFYASGEEVPDDLDDGCIPVVTTSEIDSDSRKVYVDNYIAQNVDYYEELKQKEKLGIKRSHDVIIIMALEEQEVNQELGNAFGFSSSDLRKEYDTLIKSLNLNFESTIITSDSGEIPVETQALMSELVLSAFRIQSINNKFYFYGTNSIGFKTPYKATVVYDDKFTKNWVWPEDNEQYKDYFNHFGGYVDNECDDCTVCEQECMSTCEDDCKKKCETECKKPCDKCDEAIEKYDNQRYRGLLPEVDRYYLSLIKDKRSVLKQPDQRFHLVSPCKADLIIRVTHCECYGEPSDESFLQQKLPPFVTQVMFDMPVYFETGEYNEYFDEFINNFDGENKMLYSLDDQGHIVKECVKKDLGDVLPWSSDTPYTPLCMEIDPLLNDRSFSNTEEEEPNYCYRGIKPPQLAVADVSLNVVAPAACFLGGTSLASALGPAAPIVGSISSAICSVGGNFAYSIYESKCYHWPHHGNSVLC